MPGWASFISLHESQHLSFSFPATHTSRSAKGFENISKGICKSLGLVCFSCMSGAVPRSLGWGKLKLLPASGGCADVKWSCLDLSPPLLLLTLLKWV